MTAGLNDIKTKKIIKWNENLVHCFNAVKAIFTKLPVEPFLIFLFIPNLLF